MKSKYDLEHFKKIAIDRGGVCLSDKYINCHTKMKWQCKNGHIWKTIADCILRGYWCKECSSERRKKYNLKEIKNVIKKERSGLLLSNEYKNTAEKLLWQCKYGHQWKSSISSVIFKKKWCPICRVSKSEFICKYLFETAFNKKFDKVRPDWLKFKFNKNIELDGYCAELNLAFEHNGFQHYKNTFGNLKLMKEKDNFKIKKCLDRNIKLIVIEQLFEKTSFEELKKIIAKTYFDYYNKEINKSFFKIKLENINLGNSEKAEKFYEKIKKFGGTCLNKYKNSRTSIKVKCKSEHVFNIIPFRFMSSKKLCSYCYKENNRINREKKFSKLIKDKGFKLISEYKNRNINVEILCNNSHKTIIKPTKILKSNNLNCNYCNKTNKNIYNYMFKTYNQRNTYTIAEINDIAKSRGGKLISKTYINKDQKLKWKCANDHQWSATLRNVNGRGSWCPVCAKEKRKNKHGNDCYSRAA